MSRLFVFISVLSVFVSLHAMAGTKNTTQGVLDGKLLTPPQPIANPANDDEFFFNFRLAHFAPATEPLIKETFGDELTLENDPGFWIHPSYTSCAVSFSTNLPTISMIEYGETTVYGKQTVQSDSYFYRHLHYIRGLKQNTTYHFRIIAQDYDGREVFSGNYTFTTQLITDDIIRIPEDFEGQSLPYTLNKKDSRYVLTQDLTVPTVAINIKAHNVELDLDGHTIIYDNETPTVVGDWWNDYAYDEEASFGIRAGLWNYTNAKVFNGIIKQGANGGMGYIGIGFNPLFLNHMGAGSYNEVAGVTVDYYGASVSGMVCGNGYIHHNVILDRGTVVDNRHQGIKAMTIGSNKEKNEVAYNSIRRFRHQGIMGSGYKHHNEVYSDSFDSNSFLIAAGDSGRIEQNKMFAMGYNPVGTNWASNTVINHNFIYMHGTAPEMRSTEYQRLSGIAGMRYTLYGDTDTEYENSLYEDNTIVLKAWEGCNLARGIWTATGARNKGVIYRRNTVKVEAISDKVNFKDVNAAISCVDINGGSLPLTDPLPTPMIFEDNRLIGNVNLISFGSSYGIGGSARFYRSRMERIHLYDTYFRPVRLGYWLWNTRDNYIIDAIPGEGVDLESAPTFHGSTGYMEVFYGQTKKLLITDRCTGQPLCNTEIQIETEELMPIVARTDDAGFVTFEMLTVRHGKANSTISRTDYEVYSFYVDGYTRYTIATKALEDMNEVLLRDPACDDTANEDIDKESVGRNNLFVYPNPATGYFYVNGLRGNETIRLIDMTGRLLRSGRITAPNEKIPTDGISPGIYFMQVADDAKMKTIKVVIR